MTNTESPADITPDTQPDSFQDVNDTAFYIPEGFKEQFTYGYYTYKKETAKGDIWLLWENYTWYAGDHDPSTYTLNDAPKILEDSYLKAQMGSIFDFLPSTFKTKVVNSSTDTIDNLEFLNQSGTYTFGYADDPDRTFNYDALYTLYDNTYYKAVPAYIIAITEDGNDISTNELHAITQDVAEHTAWDLDY